MCLLVSVLIGICGAWNRRILLVCKGNPESDAASCIILHANIWQKALGMLLHCLKTFLATALSTTGVLARLSMEHTFARCPASLGNSFGPACGYAVSKYSETTWDSVSFTSPSARSLASSNAWMPQQPESGNIALLPEKRLVNCLRANVILHILAFYTLAWQISIKTTWRPGMTSPRSSTD